jgi:hypothetical protein
LPAGVQHESDVDRTLPPHIKASLLSVRDWRGYKNPWMPEGGAWVPHVTGLQGLKVQVRAAGQQGRAGSGMKLSASGGLLSRQEVTPTIVRHVMPIMPCPPALPCPVLPCTALPADEKVEYSYINLLRNAERYTGYKGEHANRVWGAIYGQDMFKGVNSPDTPPEQRVFYRCGAWRALALLGGIGWGGWGLVLSSGLPAHQGSVVRLSALLSSLLRSFAALTAAPCS